MKPIELVLYTKPRCPLCDEAKETLGAVQRELDFHLVEQHRRGSGMVG